MKFSITTTPPEKLRSDCVVVGVFESRHLSSAAARLDKQCGGLLSRLMEQDDMKGTIGETRLLHNVPHALCERIVLAGCGKRDGFGDAQYRKAITAAVNMLRDTGAREAVICLPELELKARDVAWKIRQAVLAAHNALYRFENHKSKKQAASKLHHITLATTERHKPADAVRALREGEAIAAGSSLARDLGNQPSNVCTPSYLAAQAKALQKAHKKIKVSVLEVKDMQRLGMGALLAVARGAKEPAKFITLEYHGAKKTDKPIVLVGKGVTFDSGGISIKPAANMDEMKYDMSGAGSVLGTLAACATLTLPLNVVGVIPATENMPSGDAVKPGDIVTSLSGQTIEILNTDAEGRLILCDALTYSERFKPDVVIDIATLTGACVIALGKHPSGLLGNHAPLVHDLIQAGETSGDRAWELPLWDEYQDQLKTNFADMSNVGGREGGTITAACFLARFTKKFHWAHLDIAGTAWHSGDKKGSTGRPVPLLMHYLLQRCQ
ncbi:MAG: leucyl aminopeptidase [Gammaproteobacteria bacterium]|nr:leucyl aminopeptidase [Gammaproteobacteria bacterium]